MSYNNDSTSHPEKQVNLVQIAQEVVHTLLLSYNPEPLEPDADGLFHYIYITWNKDTYKFYVGKHSSKNPDTDSYIGSGFHLQRAVEKHGASSFEHRILQYTLTAQEAFDLEATIVSEDYIKLYKDELQITYNLIGGGGGNGVASEETRQKRSEAKKKYFENPEAREAQSEARKKHYVDNPETRIKARDNALKQYTVKELTDLSGTTKIKVHKDEVPQYLNEGWYFNIKTVTLYNPTTLQQVDVHMYQKGKCYKVANTPRVIKLLEEGWVLGYIPKN